MQKTEEQKMSRDDDFQSLNAALEKQKAAYEKAKEKMDAEAKKLKALQQKKEEKALKRIRVAMRSSTKTYEDVIAFITGEKVESDDEATRAES